MGDYRRCGIQLKYKSLQRTCILIERQWWSIGHEVAGRTVNGQDKKVSKMMYNETRLVELIE
jgi:hypothetical protein